ncbi:KRAB-A domain-containing protein 2 [Trichinella zimbabwensis]|uniref:KRAB-A domain-containing protein 2 n=1 Tax=Trichinella zimbabwensis TaxID=268475 RepID=A0A0V1GTS9_9BILA|nr:KRAB-A domain-containing protein 2 [Trichinella zimbabwensis]
MVSGAEICPVADKYQHSCHNQAMQFQVKQCFDGAYYGNEFVSVSDACNFVRLKNEDQIISIEGHVICRSYATDLLGINVEGAQAYSGYKLKKRFETLPDGDFQYIMTYVNHFSKFCVLRPLKSKRAPEMASGHLGIFYLVPQQYCSLIMSTVNLSTPSLLSYFPFRQRQGSSPRRPRHPQSQGSVERLNGIMQDKLAIWMKENNEQ